MSHPIHELIVCQDRLYAFILALVGNAAAAEDVLQETNLAATQRLAEAATICDFTAWLFGVARHQVQDYRRRQAREKLLFNDELLTLLADEVPAAISDFSARQQALRSCLAKLPDKQRDLILRRYAPGASVQGMASELKRTVGVVSQTLYRIRRALLECIEGKLAAESTT
ncbi:MAG TPA: sigma-70 family RNA polymerase sigma factor [Lacipirellulaceae bacterium]|nr:sigma-70 family RNA polymerase sigma factor [Lacipirellulaceae bacterium]